MQFSSQPIHPTASMFWTATGTGAALVSVMFINIIFRTRITTLRPLTAAPTLRQPVRIPQLRRMLKTETGSTE